MSIRSLQLAFSGGELSPEMFGRIDDAKNRAGLAKCRNFVTKPQGPAENRAGFAFVREVKDSTKRTRIIPFTFSTTQTMVIELGAGYFRFHTQGATLLSGAVPYEITNPYAEADLFDIHYVQSADVLTLVHPNYPPMELRRIGATNWALTSINFGAAAAVPTGVAVTTAGVTDGKYRYSYVVTAVPASGVGQSSASAVAGWANTITGVSNANPGVITVKQDHGLEIGETVTLSGVGGMPGLSGAYQVDTTPTTKTLTIKSAGVPVDTSGMGGYTGGGAVTEPIVFSNLFETGCVNTIAWSAVAGAVRYNVFKQQGGLYGYIGQTDGTTLADDNVSPDLSNTPPNYETVFATAGNYPGAVSYFEQRRCFAGSLNEPQNIRMTRSGTESDMSYSLPIRDDDRISFRVAAREANTIRHIVPLSQLLILTSSAEWRVTSINTDAITPTSISVKPQSYVGSSNVQPVIVNNSLIYGAARGGHVRELGYNWQANGFITGDLSLRAAHLFDNLDIVDMAYSKAPQQIVWMVSSNGTLLGLTYVPEQNVGAWHWHDTDGVFESCVTVAEGSEDRLYAVIRRTINGASVRYIERMASRQFATQSDAFFVDAGSTYSGVPTTSITGLTWLEGKTVNILADGAVHPQRVVTGGAITLDNAASVVQVGLPITSDLQTLPLAVQIDGGLGQGRVKNVNKAWLRVYRSGGIFVGPNENELTEAKQRTTEDYGTPPALKSEEISVVVTPSWNDSAQVFIRQTAPLPLTVVALTLEVVVGS